MQKRVVAALEDSLKRNLESLDKSLEIAKRFEKSEKSAKYTK